jgi:hypothetical protein
MAQIERRRKMSIPVGSYLVYSLRVGNKHVFGSSFTVMEVTNKNNKDVLNIETFSGGRVEMQEHGSNVWVDASGDFKIEADLRTVKSHSMLIGKAIYKPASEKVTEAFAAMKVGSDLSPIPTGNYNIFFKGGPEEGGTLTVTKISSDKAFRFEFPIHGHPGKAETPEDQAPGRFNALKKDSTDHDFYGFVLPHRIRDNNGTYFVLVGHASKSAGGEDGVLIGPDDIDPYVAVVASPPPPPYDEG